MANSRQHSALIWFALQCSKSKQYTVSCGHDHMPALRGYMRAQYPLLMAPSSTHPDRPVLALFHSAHSRLPPTHTMTGLRVWRKIDAKGEPPFSRCKHTAVMHEGQLLIFGGYLRARARYLNDVLAFDCAVHEWRTVLTSGRPPSPRRSHSAAVTAGRLVIFGGCGAGSCLNDVHTLDLATGIWRERHCTGAVPSQRGGHTGAALKGGLMVVYGGWDVGNVYFDDTYALDTATWVWEVWQ